MLIIPLRGCKTMLVIAFKKMSFRLANTMQNYYIRARTLWAFFYNCLF